MSRIRALEVGESLTLDTTDGSPPYSLRVIVFTIAQAEGRKFTTRYDAPHLKVTRLK